MRLYPALLSLGLIGCGRIGFDAAETPDAAAPDALPLPAPCVTDSRQLACYDFEGDLGDRSGGGNDAPSPTQIELVDGIDGQVLRTTAAIRIDLPSPSTVTTQYTLDAWIRPTAIPVKAIVIDHDGRWAIIVETDGRLICDANLDGIVATTLIPIGTWTHVACTHDGSTLTVFVNGRSEGSKPIPAVRPAQGDVAIAGNAPIQDTAAPFVGDLDRLRVWRVVLAPDEICEAAGGDC